MNITACPHCGAKCNTVKSYQVSPLFREVTYVCTNDACKHIFVAGIEPLRTISPSMKPNPAISLPVRV